MKSFIKIAVIILLSTAIAGAQEKKSLTMYDIETAAERPAGDRNNSVAEDERVWLQRIKDSHFAVLQLQLRSALDERNLDLKLELKKRKDELASLKAEGRKRRFKYERLPEIDFRERYIKVRLNMIREEKLHPPKPPKRQDERVYIETRKPRSKQQRLNAPTLETKVVQRQNSKLERLSIQLEELIEEGRRAGIKPWIFRD